jgi:phosphatidylinositol 3-kinase
MDRLLQKENLDLKLTPYRVLATGSDHGLLQFIPSSALASILARYNNNIQAYFREVAPDSLATESYGIDPQVMDAYVKSCAGYCVITYLLGIGDRHLDNLLLTPQGNFVNLSTLLDFDMQDLRSDFTHCRKSIPY